MPSGEKSGIEQLKRNLYSRTKEGELGVFPRRGLRELEREGMPEAWKREPQPMPRKSKSKRPLLSMLLVVAIVFFLGSVAAAAFFFFGGSTTVSSRNIDIEIKGPATIGGGEELALEITITNRNATPIEAADLLVEYPEGTRASSDLSVELPRLRESIGIIGPGERVRRTVRAVLFGEEDSNVNIQAALEYRVEDSNAIFFKEQEYGLILSTAPLAVSINAVEDVTSGQSMDLEVTVQSNSENVIENVLLSAEYPFGFNFVESSPDPIFTNTVWKLGDIEPEGKRTVIISGTVVGEDAEERVFRFAAGVQSDVDDTQLQTAFITKSHSLVIEKPFIGADLALDGNSAPEHVARSGERIRGDITWFNNLPVQIQDAEIELELEGDILDKKTVESQTGFYSSGNSILSWARDTNNDLATLGAGSYGSVSFTFAPHELAADSVFRNPEIILRLTIRGRRLSENNVPEKIESTEVRRVKVASDLFLASRAVYFTGPFVNAGPLPPRVEQDTTYTILWTVTNSHNNVARTRVTAALPSYMRFVGTVDPSTEDVSFNEVGGMITWDVGDVPPGGKRDVAFQIGLTPSVSQLGTSPLIMNEQSVIGSDLFTRTEIKSSQPPLTTRLSTDPNFASTDANVIE